MYFLQPSQRTWVQSHLGLATIHGDYALGKHEAMSRRPPGQDINGQQKIGTSPALRSGPSTGRLGMSDRAYISCVHTQASRSKTTSAGTEVDGASSAMVNMRNFLCNRVHCLSRELMMSGQ